MSGRKGERWRKEGEGGNEDDSEEEGEARRGENQANVFFSDTGEELKEMKNKMKYGRRGKKEEMKKVKMGKV